jgi:hypothetical protein
MRTSRLRASTSANRVCPSDDELGVDDVVDRERPGGRILAITGDGAELGTPVLPYTVVVGNPSR